MFRFRFRRLAIRTGLDRSKGSDLSSSEWAEARAALNEGRQAYAEVMASPSAPELRSSEDRASRVDYSLMVQ